MGVHLVFRSDLWPAAGMVTTHSGVEIKEGGTRRGQGAGRQGGGQELAKAFVRRLICIFFILQAQNTVAHT